MIDIQHEIAQKEARVEQLKKEIAVKLDIIRHLIPRISELSKDRKQNIKMFAEELRKVIQTAPDKIGPQREECKLMLNELDLALNAEYRK